MKIHCKWLLLCGLVTMALVVKSQVRFQAESGVLDARTWDFKKARLPLAGYWLFYPNQLVDVHNTDSASKRDLIVPALWNSTREDGSGKGFGTYGLSVIVPKGIGEFTLEVPQLYNAYTLIINNNVVARVGTVGRNKEETIPSWNHQLLKFQAAKNDTLHILLQIANFHHAKGGIKEQLFLGVPENTQATFTVSKLISTFESGLLLLFGIIFIVIYFVRGQPVSLYFGLFGVNWSLRALFSNLYVVMDWFPDLPWTFLVRTEYMTLYVAMITATAFLHHLFKKMGAKPLMTYVLVGVNVVFAIFTMVTSPAVFTKSVSLFVSISAITVIYGAILVVRALFYGYPGAWFLMASILIGIITFGYDIIAYQTSLAPNFTVLSCGYIAMFSLTALGLLFQMNVLKSSSSSAEMLTYDEMMKR
ncbi:7TM-DISM domain-containing protein [Pseudochryseolinea flava]|uniref:7TM-DISM receptor extracellular domain-containing protein n=1 Tax=Pseudochryseolinea flava TaxID=2059302 RepID=A0A364Y4V3_9BACT|nr:7TM-DISM domain-containing protein [Pseudochryseolinea flava]RAW01071.1 hypothetical protein DQQ10_12645 [Pseudochryseolinea flava]